MCVSLCIHKQFGWMFTWPILSMLNFKIVSRKTVKQIYSDMETQQTFLSAADTKILGKKKQRKVNKWKDRQRKALRNAGKPYINRKGKENVGKSPPKEVSGRTVYVTKVATGI